MTYPLIIGILVHMNISTKYTQANVTQSVISDTGKIVIHNVPKSIKRALRTASERSGDSMRDGGSESFEAYKAVLYYLEKARGINVSAILKSNV